MSDLYFNKESDYSEENTTMVEWKRQKGFHSTILQLFQFEPEQKKTCGNESHEKETTEAVSSSQIFFKIGVLKNLANFTGKHPWLEPLFNTVAGLKTLLRRHSTRVFSCEICEIFKNIFFLQNTSSGYLWN